MSDESELRLVTVLLPPVEYIRAIWDRRLFASTAPRYELTAQNMDRVLGNLWLILNPLLQVGVYYIFFGVLIGTRGGVENFTSFLTIGVFVFSFSNRSIMSSANSITQNLGLIRSLRFPRAILPISINVASTIAYGPILIVMLLVVLVDAGLPPAAIALLPIIISLQVVFNLGAGFIVGRLNMMVPDTENILNFLFRLVFYMSGILYSVEVYVDQEMVRELFALNPFYAYIELNRLALIGTSPGPWVWFSGIAWAAVLTTVGFEFFRRGELSYGRG